MTQCPIRKIGGVNCACAICRSEQASTPKTLLIGEANPYGADPKFALYPYPEQSAGGRLCRQILGLQAVAYLRRFDRVNLCGAVWSLKHARSSALAILENAARPTVLLGAKVCRAFNIPYAPFDKVTSSSSTGPRELVILPHPSGRCLLWNAAGAFERARAVLREAGAL